MDLAVDKFYDRLLSDKDLAPFFRNTKMGGPDGQRAKQKKFLKVALGKRDKWDGLGMATAHRKLVAEQGMTDVHFDLVAKHLVETLRELGVDADIVATVGSAVEGMRDEVMCRGKWA